MYPSECPLFHINVLIRVPIIINVSIRVPLGIKCVHQHAPYFMLRGTLMSTFYVKGTLMGTFYVRGHSDGPI
ncbi:unnamed protein product [Staurois parvus]|uniref:Uncharacterized protein n=1 Tax=Staurois parvus TaxID=386267 RepID=A0ABN9EXD0_9NEOB|nr:unnamed protein product [Staurois parvus]